MSYKRLSLGRNAASRCLFHYWSQFLIQEWSVYIVCDHFSTLWSLKWVPLSSDYARLSVLLSLSLLVILYIHAVYICVLLLKFVSIIQCLSTIHYQLNFHHLTIHEHTLIGEIDKDLCVVGTCYCLVLIISCTLTGAVWETWIAMDVHVKDACMLPCAHIHSCHTRECTVHLAHVLTGTEWTTAQKTH